MVNRVRDGVRAVGGTALKIHGTGMQEKGHPDIFGSIRLKGKGVTAAFVIETKTPEGRLSEIQVERIKQWYTAGLHVAVIFNINGWQRFYMRMRRSLPGDSPVILHQKHVFKEHDNIMIYTDESKIW